MNSYPIEESEFFTTGEIAKACGVSVRTVQYYDEKNLLPPAQRSAGGRRMYAQADVEKLHTICLLKDLGLSLQVIGDVVEKPEDTRVLLCLLEEQEKVLLLEAEENRQTLDQIHRMIIRLKDGGKDDAFTGSDMKEHSSVNENSVNEEATINSPPAITGISPTSTILAKRSVLKSIKRKMLFEGAIISQVWIVTILIGWQTGNWLPLLCAIPLALVISGELVWAYHRAARYVCAHCRQEFQPRFWEFNLASHSPKARKLTCPSCKTKDWCVERSVEVVTAFSSASASVS
ncbi:MerR family transcriptional regulator [Schaalia vaccimaxillae]|uniref:MerR family transcriptional regulator n=1 Tax=Schaalia vaccimaxillae TaxID=183916 RepID=UPI0003B54F65|nr:MerR family transcriptional regulator [Schaalia vaccimaxillae]